MYNQLTNSDIKKMEEEIEYRKCVIRKELLEHVKTARAQGDLSENFEYYAAKKEKNRNESRIRYLERMIKTAKIVSEQSNEGEVGLNDTVVLHFEEDDERETYKVVTTMREDILNHKISKESPLGRAIFGHKLKEKVFVKVNDTYGYFVVIEEIQKTGEEEEDAIRSF